MEIITNADYGLAAHIIPRPDGRFAVHYRDTDVDEGIGITDIVPTHDAAVARARAFVDGTSDDAPTVHI